MIRILGTPLQVISEIINACDRYTICARGQRENRLDAPPRTCSYYIYIYINMIIIIIYNMVRAVLRFIRSTSASLYTLCAGRTLCYFFRSVCVSSGWLLYDRVYMWWMRVGSRGVRTLEVLAGALWKGFATKMDRETSAKREIESEWSSLL